MMRVAIVGKGEKLMTVLLGAKTEKTVILAGDNRGTNKNTDETQDILEKVHPINNHLCIASAGTLAISEAILMNVNKMVYVDDLFIEDIIETIEKFYDDVQTYHLVKIQKMVASFLIGGMKKDGKTGLFTIHNNSGRVKTEEISTIFTIIPPEDVSINVASTIMIKNVKNHQINFIEQTVQEISEISRFVSPTGDKWIYDAISDTCRMESF